jgi:hypothetical protein
MTKRWDRHQIASDDFLVTLEIAVFLESMAELGITFEEFFLFPVDSFSF